ncbi:hypothetical protein K440DRAFT_260950 [Wilcoxina mikolae CBS 423.85]|nr:hypothetical protein K440DRAFT_260950 [Wilcoxina mikolae CBS 423.85]
MPLAACWIALKPQNYFFWNLLKCFWPEETVCELQHHYSSSVHCCSNGISMKSDVHDIFDDLGFYPEPKFDTITNTSYEVAFHWKDGEGNILNYWEPRILEGYTVALPFKNAQTFRFETSDPEAYPLPDPHLLYLRSVLIRAAFAVGGASAVDYDSDTAPTSCDDISDSSDTSRRSLPENQKHIVKPVEQISFSNGLINKTMNYFARDVLTYVSD